MILSCLTVSLQDSLAPKAFSLVPEVIDVAVRNEERAQSNEFVPVLQRLCSLLNLSWY